MHRLAAVVIAALLVSGCEADGGSTAATPSGAATSTTVPDGAPSPTTGTTSPTTVPETTTTAAAPSTTAATTTSPEWPPPDMGLLTVVTPAPRLLTAEPMVTVIGASPPGTTVVIGDAEQEVGPGEVQWSSQVELVPGEQLVTISAVRGDEAADSTVSITYDPGLEVRFGFLNGIERGDPGWTIWLDPAVLLEGEEADEYAGEEVVDGYLIVDDDPGVIEGLVAADDVLMVMWEGRAPRTPPMVQVAATAGEVLSAFDGAVESPWWLVPEPAPVHVYLSDGVVVQVAQRWLP